MGIGFDPTHNILRLWLAKRLQLDAGETQFDVGNLSLPAPIDRYGTEIIAFAEFIDADDIAIIALDIGEREIDFPNPHRNAGLGVAD